MNDEKERPRYTIINHSARSKFGLTIIEYCVADSIRVIGKINPDDNGWIQTSKKYLSEFLNCTDRSVYNALNTLEKKGLIERKTFKKSNCLKVSSLRTTPMFNTAARMKEKGTEKISEPTEKTSDNNDTYNDTYKESISSASLMRSLSFLKKPPYNLEEIDIQHLVSVEENSINTIKEVAKWWKECYYDVGIESDCGAIMYKALEEDYSLYDYYEWGRKQLELNA
ncbi:MAG: hypothetical protein AMS17_11060 [Spirochaetes bacterium DG_61]|nr:MAG: hypothetical protein AMS17_11060 [Spirochaetes bacterium DG_61]